MEVSQALHPYRAAAAGVTKHRDPKGPASPGLSLISKSIEAIAVATRMIDRLVSMDDLSARAVEMAVKFGHPIYDCFYLALAERERCLLATADDRLAKIAAKMKVVQTRRL